MWWFFVGLDGICGRSNGGGDDGGCAVGLEKIGWPDDSGRARTGDELPFMPFMPFLL